MSTETPRTDANLEYPDGYAWEYQVVKAEFARQLERELAARPDVDELVKALDVELQENRKLKFGATIGEFEMFVTQQHTRLHALLARDRAQTSPNNLPHA